MQLRSLLPPRALLGLALALLGCSSSAAPEVRTDSTAETAPIVASHGALHADASERVVDSRLDSRHDTERVRVMVDAFRAQAQTPLVAGNRVRLLVDGPQTLGAIRRAIEEARDHVHVETYIFADDDIGRQFRDLLMRRHPMVSRSG
jgi:cardiolipin synthase